MDVVCVSLCLCCPAEAGTEYYLQFPRYNWVPSYHGASVCKKENEKKPKIKEGINSVGRIEGIKNKNEDDAMKKI